MITICFIKCILDTDDITLHKKIYYKTLLLEKSSDLVIYINCLMEILFFVENRYLLIIPNGIEKDEINLKLYARKVLLLICLFIVYCKIF